VQAAVLLRRMLFDQGNENPKVWLLSLRGISLSRMAQPDLITICFAGKSISSQRRTFSSATCTQKLTGEMMKSGKIFIVKRTGRQE